MAKFSPPFPGHISPTLHFIFDSISSFLSWRNFPLLFWLLEAKTWIQSWVWNDSWDSAVSSLFWSWGSTPWLIQPRLARVLALNLTSIQQIADIY